MFKNNYWNQRYLSQQTGWDLGEISPPLKQLIDQLTDKSVRILIPGCGNSYEASYLHALGFTSITVLDIAEEPIKNLRLQYANKPEITVFEGDFFEHEGKYDLIIEQTFFCAIHPSLRLVYAQKMHALLQKKGRLAGLLFATNFTKPGPPFGGDIMEYQALFEPYFTCIHLAPCTNSALPRMGNELFFCFEK